MGIARLSLRSWLSVGSCACAMGVLAWSSYARTFGLHDVNPLSAVLKSHQVRRQGLPFYFEANQGQTEGRVSFVARARGYIAFLRPAELVLAFGLLTTQRAPWDPARKPSPRPAAQPIGMRFVGANAQATLRGGDAQSGKVNYFIGRDESGWRRNVDTFARLDAHQIYPGIDVRYYGGSGRELAFDAIVSPYADPSQLRLAFDGAKRIEVSQEGSLQVDTGNGLLQLSKPFIYQEGEGGRVPVAGGYVLDQGEVRIQLGEYDRSRALVIDPVLAYSTYLGGTNDEYAFDIKVDKQGYIYVLGPTLSSDYPIKNAIQPVAKGGIIEGDMFISKLTPDGSALVYSTYFGGSLEEYPGAIALGSDDSVYIAGSTSSPDYPLKNPIQSACVPDDVGQCLDGVVTKLSPDGSSLQYSTRFGGVGNDGFTDVAVDSDGSVFVVGSSFSEHTPTLNALQDHLAGRADAILAKLNPQGSALVFSTYLGGVDLDEAANVVLDLAGNAYVTGNTYSPDFPVVNAFQPGFGGMVDDFVLKIDPLGRSLVYSTYLGGSDVEGGEGGISVNADGTVYVTNSTLSRDFPVRNAIQASYRGGSSIGDVYVAKLGAKGNELLFSTYLGGTGDDGAEDVVSDAAGFVYVTGLTQSYNFPVVKAPQPNYGGGLHEVFVSKLTPTGSALVFSTYLGGTSDDVGTGIALGPNNNVYVTGLADLGEFPTVNPFQPQLAGGQDAFISRYRQTLEPEIRVDPQIVRFGRIHAGTARNALVVIHNDGDAPLTVSSITGLPALVTLLGPNPPFPIQPGFKTAVWLQWRPAAPGRLQAAIQLASTDMDEPSTTVVLLGTAISKFEQEGEE